MRAARLEGIRPSSRHDKQNVRFSAALELTKLFKSTKGACTMEGLQCVLKYCVFTDVTAHRGSLRIRGDIILARNSEWAAQGAPRGLSGT